MRSKRLGIIAVLVGVGIVALVTTAVVGIALGGGKGGPATRAEYQVTVATSRDQVDYALERIAESQSVDELINRIEEAGVLVDHAAGELDHAEVAAGFEGENARLVTTLHSYSDALSSTAATMRDPSFASSLSSINSLSYPQWDTVNKILAKLRRLGIKVSPLYRHGGVG